MSVIDKRLKEAEKYFEESYHMASVTYDKETKTVNVSLRTRNAYSWMSREGRPIGTHYVNIPVIFSKLDGLSCGNCTMYKVSYDGKDYDGKEVNPTKAFDPGVDAASVVRKVVEFGKLTSRSVKYVNVRHVAY